MTSPQDVQKILEERARRLARRSNAESVPNFGVDVVSFSVARERFAIESAFVFAVFHLNELVPLPGARAPVVGVTRWRGDVLTVLDLRRVVGGTGRALDDLARVIVVGASGPAFGVLADTVDDIMSIDPTTLFTLPVDRVPEIPGVLRGVTANGIHLLDAAILIAHQDGGASSSPVVGVSTSSNSDQL
ncbi:MAG: chemotaxis protein CheW [Gemmatimonadaceae bacterium]